MDHLDQNQIFLLLGALIVGFILGRKSKSGGGGETSVERAMREQRRSEELLSELSPDALMQVDELMRARKKIEAIKFLREKTGCGLKEGKDAVETRARAVS